MPYHSIKYKPVFLLASAPVSLVDMPKSDNIALPLDDNNILPAFISRCILRCSCTCNRPSRLLTCMNRYAYEKRYDRLIIISVFREVCTLYIIKYINIIPASDNTF